MMTFTPENLRKIASDIRIMRMRMLTDIKSEHGSEQAEAHFREALALLDLAQIKLEMAIIKQRNGQ